MKTTSVRTVTVALVLALLAPLPATAAEATPTPSAPASSAARTIDPPITANGICDYFPKFPPCKRTRR